MYYEITSNLNSRGDTLLYRNSMSPSVVNERERIMKHTTLSECQFNFNEDNVVYKGFTDGSSWNGFDNVKVNEKTHNDIVEYFTNEMGDDVESCYFDEIEKDEYGLFDYSNGYTTTIINKKTNKKGNKK